MEAEGKKKKKFKIKAPDALVLIVALLIFCTILTYIVPTGQYDRFENPETGVMMVDPDTYHRVPRNPVSFGEMLMAIPQGMTDSASIIMFLFIIGGAFGVITKTGVLDALIGNTVKTLDGKERLVIPFILIFWALAGSYLGCSEECLAFIPIQIMLCLALGFDSIVASALGMVGVTIGYMGAQMNAFTIAIAQDIAGLPTFSGIGFRFCLWAILVISAIIYIWIYAGKIKKDPTKSPMYEEDLKSPYRNTDMKPTKLTARHKGVLAVFVGGVIFLIFGVINYGFYLDEMGAVFIFIAAASGIIGGLGLNGTVDSFIDGAHNLLYACICVGFARALTIVMTNGLMLDAVVHAITSLLMDVPHIVKAPFMFLTQALINIIMPSGSGQAVVTMPIMVPIADVLGITRQTAVLCFQLGDGLTNFVTPTSGELMAGIAIAGISWNKWVKWYWKLIVVFIIISLVATMVAAGTGYGPF